MKAAPLSYLHVPDDCLEEAPQRAALPLHLVLLSSVGAAHLHLRQEENNGKRAGRPPDRCGPGRGGDGGAEAQMLAGGSPPRAQAAHLPESVIAAACWSRKAATGQRRGLRERERQWGAGSSVEGGRHGEREERAWRGVCASSPPQTFEHEEAEPQLINQQLNCLSWTFPLIVPPLQANLLLEVQEHLELFPTNS